MKITCDKCGNEIEVNEAAALGKKGRQRNSPAQQAASRANGRKHVKKKGEK